MDKGMISDTASVSLWQQFFCDVIVVPSSRKFSGTGSTFLDLLT